MADSTPTAPPFDDRLWKSAKRFELHLPGFLRELGPDCAEVDPGPPPAGFPLNEIEAVRAARSALDTDPDRRRRVLDQDANFPEFLTFLGLSWKAVETRWPWLHVACFTVPIIATRPVLMVLKARYAIARPVELAPDINPIIDNPGHPAYPSGHTCQTRLSVLMLNHIVPARLLNADQVKTMENLAEDVAKNREHAGIHYPSDTAAGRRLADACLPHVLRAFSDIVTRAAKEAETL